MPTQSSSLSADTNSYALARAARQNKMTIARVLSTQDPKAAPSGSYGALHMAALMGHLDMLTVLLNTGFDINTVDNHVQAPPHDACGANMPFPEIVQRLYRKGSGPIRKKYRNRYYTLPRR